MADPKVLISELTTDPAPALATMLFPQTRSGATRKIAGNTLADLVNAKLASVSAAATLASVIGVNGSGAIVKATVDSDALLAANSDLRLATQKAVKTYVDNIVAVQDAMVFKGVIDCSANPNYPAASRGWTYRVSVAGKIGGASGPNVEVGDILICITDGTASGNQATVGAQWSIIQVNIDGALTTANIGSTVQAYDATLAALAALVITNGSFIRGTGADAFAVQAMVGTVSQSGGVPTGAIIERGSNANGEYTRWADGTQECFINTLTSDATITTGSSFRGAAMTWTYPAAFVAGSTPVPFASANQLNGWANAFPAFGFEATQANVLRWATTSQASAVAVYAHARGRWF